MAYRLHIYGKALLIIGACLGAFFSLASNARAQGVGIGTEAPDNSALLHLETTKKGFLPPRLTTIQRDSIQSPAAGLTIFNKTVKIMQYFNGECWLNVFQENCTDCYFNMSLADSSGVIDRTQTDSIAIQINLSQYAGTPQNITMGLFGNLPLGFSHYFTPNPIEGEGVCTLVLKVTPFTPAGTFLIPIQALCGPSMRSIVFALTLEPCYELFVNNSLQNYDVSNALYTTFPDAPTATPVCVAVYVGNGVGVTSPTTAQPAFTTGELPAGSVIGIVNKGYIIGHGGDGGDAWEPFAGLTGEGEDGGHALNLTQPAVILNEGRLYGGGGGGNSMAFRICTPNIPIIGQLCFGIGSGGGGGAGGGLGGDAGALIQYYAPGTNGTEGIFGLPGVGGVLNTPITLSVGPAALILNPNTVGGNGGTYGAPGTIGTFNLTVTGQVQIPFVGAVTVGPFNIPIPVNPPAFGDPGNAVKRNGFELEGLPDANYQTDYIKGAVGP